MSEEELIEKNNILLSHNNLPKGMTTCENYGLSGNCGLNCPLFKNKSCEVYDDVAERIITNLQQENKQLKDELNTKKKLYWQNLAFHRGAILKLLEHWLNENIKYHKSKNDEKEETNIIAGACYLDTLTKIQELRSKYEPK